MDEVHPAMGPTRAAVACLTVWMACDRVDAAMHLARLKYDPDGPGEEELMVGLLNLSHILLLELAKERGATTAGDFAKEAHEILHDLAL